MRADPGDGHRQSVSSANTRVGEDTTNAATWVVPRHSDNRVRLRSDLPRRVTKAHCDRPPAPARYTARTNNRSQGGRTPPVTRAVFAVAERPSKPVTWSQDHRRPKPAATVLLVKAPGRRWVVVAELRTAPPAQSHRRPWSRGRRRDRPGGAGYLGLEKVAELRVQDDE